MPITLSQALENHPNYVSQKMEIENLSSYKNISNDDQYQEGVKFVRNTYTIPKTKFIEGQDTLIFDKFTNTLSIQNAHAKLQLAENINYFSKVYASFIGTLVGLGLGQMVRIVFKKSALFGVASSSILAFFGLKIFPSFVIHTPKTLDLTKD